MGIYDRDYYREATRSSPLRTGVAPVCKWLIIANVIVYVLQLMTRQQPDGGVTGLLALDPESTMSGLQVWRIFTAGFCHSPSDIFHILFNMLFLWWFGKPIEQMYGSREFFYFYATALFLSSFAFLGLQFTLGESQSMIGASGAVMAVLIVYAMYYPRHPLHIYFVIPVEIRWIVLFYVAYDLLPVFAVLTGRPDPFGGHVAHAAHLGGLAYGFCYKQFDLRFSRLLSGKFRRPWKSTPRVRIYREPPPTEAPPPDIEARVDSILAKIKAQGESSLTEEERKTLIAASQRYRNRRQ